MPQTEVLFFMDKTGNIPALERMQRLPKNVQDKLGGAIKRLGQMGYELRRPECDYLRNKIYELRVRLQGINYRLLYFFHRKQAIISHGLTKERIVPPKEIDKAIANSMLYETNPDKYSYRMR